MRLRVLLSLVSVACVASSGRGLSGPRADSPTMALEALTISGPTTVAPGHGATFTATGRLADGTTRDVSDRAIWRSSNSFVLCVSERGAATGATSGEVQLVASLGGLTATSSVLVVPAGTFRLAGTVSEAGRPLAGATVAVIAGPGLGLSAMTNGAGAYVLYGVGGGVEIQVTKAGYAPITKAITLTRSGVLDFADLTRESERDGQRPRD